MGRPKRDYPEGKFVLDKKGRHEEDALYPIVIQYVWNTKPIRKTTGIKCYLKDWDPKGNRGRGELRSSYGKNYARQNSFLNDRIQHYDDMIKDYFIKHGGGITIDVLAEIMSDKPLTRADEGKDFYEFAKERLDSEYNRKKIQYSRYKNGISSLNMFEEFLLSTGNGTYKKGSIYLSELTADLLDKLITWRRDIKHNSDATINHALTPLLKAADAAAAMGLLSMQQNATIQEMRISLKKTVDDTGEVEFDGKYLTKEQLRQLLSEYENTKEVSRREYIELFLFAFHACGLRVVDVMTLQWGHINFEKREIKKILVKTNKRHIIPLTDPAIEILKKWKSKERKNRYVFDLLSDDIKLSDEETIYKRRNSITQSINQSLIVVGEHMQLPFTLTMHVARHTFAVLALNDGMNMSVISRLLGHSSTDITEKVYAKFLSSTLTEEVEKLHYSFLPSNLNS